MKDLLLKAATEIRSLRNENRILAAKAEVIDIFAAALSADPRRRDEIWSEDILPDLMRAAEMQERAKAAAEAAYTEFDAPGPDSPLQHVSV